MGDVMGGDELIDEVFFIVVEIVHEPVDFDVLDQGRIDACGFDQFGVVVYANALCY